MIEKGEEMEIRCSKCGYGWDTGSKLKYISCPSCLQKVQNPSWRKTDVKSLEEIRGALARHRGKLRKDFRVREIGIFGSYARGGQGAGSDIDILVEFEEGHETFDNYMELKFFLEEVLGTKVDLVPRRASSRRPSMSERYYAMFLNDILAAAEKTLRYVGDRSFEEFVQDEMLVDAVTRNLEVIGKSAKNLPASVREKHGDVEWRKIAELGDILIHGYFGIDHKILWDVVKNKVPRLKERTAAILEAERTSKDRGK